MKHFICFLFFCLLTLSGLQGQSGSANTGIPVDSLYTFMKNNSIHRDRVDWKKFDRKFKGAIASAKNLQDTMNCFTMVLEALDDVHSQMYYKRQLYNYWHIAPDSVISRAQRLMALARSTVGKVKCEMLTGHFLYIRLPGYNTIDPVEIERYGRAIRDSLARYEANEINGFILDLRLNTGGNMYPMLSGLGQVLGDGIILYEINKDADILRTYKIENGNLTMNGQQITRLMSQSNHPFARKPVAVLLGPVTSSSATVTAIAFEGRENTVFIGEHTAEGYTTSNGFFQFSPDLILNFAVAFVADRNHHPYKDKVDPDIQVYGGDDFQNLTQDEKIKRAIRWLKEKAE